MSARNFLILTGMISAGILACSPAPDRDAGSGPPDTAALATSATPADEADHQPVAGSTPDPTASISIDEWLVPWDGRPRDPYTLDGRTVWFVGQRNSYIARLDVETGEMERIDLREGAGPYNLIVNGDGDVWYAGNRDAHLGFYDVDLDSFTYVDTPPDTAADPHTLVFDANEDIWFTSQRANSIGRYRVETGQLDILPVPTPSSRPYGIKIAPDGMIWAVLFGSHKIVSVHPETLELTEYDIPEEDARPRRIGITSDGRIWYGDYARGFLGMLDPTTGAFSEWAMPSGENARPYALATDGQDRIWFVETGVDPNYFVGFDPATQSFFSVVPVPSGGGVIRHMHYLPETEEIWFGSDMGTIGRLNLD